MNTMHEPAGSPKGGRFASHNGICIRGENPQMDLREYAKQIDEEQDEERKNELIMNALYDGGYLITKEKVEDANSAAFFIKQITSNYKATNEWLGHKDYVKNYVSVVKGYITDDKWDLVINGHYSGTSKERNAEELMSEFSLQKAEVKKIISENLTEDDFIASGINSSSYISNTGTVVMEFSPRVTLYKETMTPNGPKRRKFTVDLYLKMVINPHPDPERRENSLQVISIKEAHSKVLLFSSKDRKSREEWKKDRKNPNNPQMEKRGK